MRLKRIQQVGLGSRLDLGFWRSGVCPWDGSKYGSDRSGHQSRHCNNCDTDFENLCPICGNPQNSLGYNSHADQWGCDQCGSIFIEEYI